MVTDQNLGEGEVLVKKLLHQLSTSIFPSVSLQNVQQTLDIICLQLFGLLRGNQTQNTL